MNSRVLLEKGEPEICTISLNRPNEINPVNKEGLSGLLNARNAIALDGSVRVVILEGAGGNCCVGADLALLDETNDSPDFLGIMEQLKRVILALRGCYSPSFRR